MNGIRIKKAFVNDMPSCCGECPLMIYTYDTPICTALPEEVREIQGNPYAMTYRRSDCVLEPSTAKTVLR